MGLFSKWFETFRKNDQKAQPCRDWPWTLNLSGYPSTQISWEILSSELRELNLADVDSFLILEQKDPENPEAYWYIQSAIAKAGPSQGQYIVGVGWFAPEHNQMWERCVPQVEQVIRYFDQAFNQYRMDFSGFEDQSDMLS